MKRNLNSDGQQFHQYQQHEQPHLTSSHWTQTRPRIPGSDMGQAQQSGGVKLVNWTPSLLLFIIGQFRYIQSNKFIISYGYA